ncbi:ABC transporter ATP-binding protein [Thermoanaerobacterium sp. RBIITD]|uniref:ABC transporter ATP-binding protein n=1 Tax=Thermoanaerobacterium sp. RBIITD TaxID=1550240 RepID=UPI000BB92D1B|nr:ABC transporter ATP-binding protein [Thermoanaerobacterium sp. RBIITD]SNX54237.1 iron(III) transport system ATP-binding protein [Thermoanaerobacterium sp. RBIITD]
MMVEINDLLKKFGDFTALNSIRLSVEMGEFLAILGPSGCGKTTLLRLIAGFDVPTSGEIRINDKLVANKSYSEPPEKRNIGMVFQSFALWPHMNVKEHILFPLRYHKFITSDLKEDINKRADEVLNIVGLQNLYDRKPYQLSGGQKQRVALARAISPKPSLLLMDEPLSSLDAELRIDMRKEIKKIHDITKTTIIYVTHDQAEALAMADRIVVMKDGKIQQIGNPEEIYTNPQNEFVAKFVGKANLIKGHWTNDIFIPDLNKEIKWNGENIAEEFRNKAIYPVRPEQFKIKRNGVGIKGRITNIQYQGKEFLVTVKAYDQYINAIENVYDRFSIGDTVNLILK